MCQSDKRYNPFAPGSKNPLLFKQAQIQYLLPLLNLDMRGIKPLEPRLADDDIFRYYDIKKESHQKSEQI